MQKYNRFPGKREKWTAVVYVINPSNLLKLTATTELYKIAYYNRFVTASCVSQYQKNRRRRWPNFSTYQILEHESAASSVLLRQQPPTKPSRTKRTTGEKSTTESRSVASISFTALLVAQRRVDYVKLRIPRRV